MKQIGHLPSWREGRAELAAWCAVLGARKRGSVKPDEIRRVRVQWLEAGLEPKTINNRVNSLARLYSVLDGWGLALVRCSRMSPTRP